MSGTWSASKTITVFIWLKFEVEKPPQSISKAKYIKASLFLKFKPS